MTVRLIDKNAPDYMGASTDPKPTVDGAGVTLPTGTSYLEYDTKKTWIFDGVSTWY